MPEFWMGKYAITQAQWGAIATLQKIDRDLAPDPASSKSAKRPVENVRWKDAMEFCKRLSQKTGRDYQLPSEAQWEYACRAGTTTPFYFGPTITTELANYRGTDWKPRKTTYPGSYGKGPKGSYRKKTTEVGSFIPNTFGLYDMHGNVWEWCMDGWHGSYEGAPIDGNNRKLTGQIKILRGGSWLNLPRLCRSADRDSNRSGFLNDAVGFRVVCFSLRT